MLFAHVVPPAGGETEFADLRAAYDALARAMQARIEDLVAEHSIFHSRGQLGHTDYTEAERAVLPPARHRLVRVHPGSKRKTLYMGAHASHIVGWPMPDGRLLLRDLMEHATQREFVHRHNWRVGDLVIWDNRCTLHRGRPYDDAAHPRDLRRVTTRDPGSRSSRWLEADWQLSGLSVLLPPVAKIAVAGALHDGLCARELYVGAKTLGEGKVHAADQQESKLRLTQLLVELRVPASRDVDLIGILRLRADAVVDGVTSGERGKRRRHVLSHVPGFFRPPPLFAEATINIA